MRIEKIIILRKKIESDNFNLKRCTLVEHFDNNSHNQGNDKDYNNNYIVCTENDKITSLKIV